MRIAGNGINVGRKQVVKDIPAGTVFLFGSLTCGPYLKLWTGQVIDLESNSLYFTEAAGSTELPGYIDITEKVKVVIE